MTADIVPAGQPPARQTWTQDQLDLLKRTIAAGTSDDEFALFCQVATRTGLDPFARQIYAIVRGGRMTIQTGIDGYRLIAARTGCHAGTDDATYTEGPDGRPKIATVVVYKIVGNHVVPFTASARWEEYCPGDKQDSMWRKMPHTMLGKCAEALALRKAFPAELSGVYTDDELNQADSAAVALNPPSRPHVAHPGDRAIPASAADNGPGEASDDYSFTDPNWWIDHLAKRGVKLTELRGFHIRTYGDLAKVDGIARTEILRYIDSGGGR